MKKLLYSAFFVGLFCCSMNAEVSAQDSKKQHNDFKVFVRDFGSTKVRLSDEGKVLIFADPSLIVPIFNTALFGLLTAGSVFVLANSASRKRLKDKNEELGTLLGMGLVLIFSIYSTLDLMKKIERKNKKTPWLTLDENQIAIDEGGMASFFNWGDITDTYWESVTYNGITCRSVVEFKDKNDATLGKIDGMYLPIEPKEFCKLVDYYLSIQD